MADELEHLEADGLGEQCGKSRQLSWIRSREALEVAVDVEVIGGGIGWVVSGLL